MMTFTREMAFATISTTTQGVVGMVATAVPQPVDMNMSQRHSARRSVANDGVVIAVSSVIICVLLRD